MPITLKTTKNATNGANIDSMLSDGSVSKSAFSIAFAISSGVGE